MKKEKSGISPLGFKARRGIEQKYGVFLAEPENPKRSTNEQIGVYDEDEEFVGDIMAKGAFFTTQELGKKIKALFGK